MFVRQRIADRRQFSGGLFERDTLAQTADEAQVPDVARTGRIQLLWQPQIDLGDVPEFHVRLEHADHGDDLPADLQRPADRIRPAVHLVTPVVMRQHGDRHGSGRIIALPKPAADERRLTHRGEHVGRGVTDRQGMGLAVPDERRAALAQARQLLERRGAGAVVEQIRSRDAAAKRGAVRIRREDRDDLRVVVHRQAAEQREIGERKTDRRGANRERERRHDQRRGARIASQHA